MGDGRTSGLLVIGLITSVLGVGGILGFEVSGSMEGRRYILQRFYHLPRRLGTMLMDGPGGRPIEFPTDLLLNITDSLINSIG